MAGLGPEITVKEALEQTPDLQTKVACCEEERAKAAESTNRLQEICTDDREFGFFLADEANTYRQELSALKSQTRDELRSLRSACDVVAQAGRIKTLADVIAYLENEFEFNAEVTTGGNQVLHADGVVNLLEAEHALLVARCQLSRATTIAALGPIMENEGGRVGLMGGKTEALREAAAGKYLQLIQARQDAREARVRYEARLNLRLAHGGIITSAQTGRK